MKNKTNDGPTEETLSQLPPGVLDKRLEELEKARAKAEKKGEAKDATKGN